jgi:hypothetical protein
MAMAATSSAPIAASGRWALGAEPEPEPIEVDAPD